MNIELPKNILSKKQLILYILIIVICIVSIIVAFYVQFFAKINIGSFFKTESKGEFANKTEEQKQLLKTRI